MDDWRLPGTKVQLGNWYEENCRHQAMIDEIKEKGKIGALAFQRTEKITKLAFNPTPLQPESKYIKEGQGICFNHTPSQSSLCISFSSKSIPERQLELPMAATSSHIDITCSVNTFTIIPCEKPLDGYIRYGKDVLLIHEGDLFSETLYLDSQSGFFPPAYQKSDVQGIFFSPVLNRMSRWKIEPFSQEERREFEILGRRICHNDNILLTHVATGKHVTVWKDKPLQFTFKGFPNEFEITVDRVVDSHKIETDKHLFKIVSISADNGKLL